MIAPFSCHQRITPPGTASHSASTAIQSSSPRAVVSSSNTTSRDASIVTTSSTSTLSLTTLLPLPPGARLGRCFQRAETVLPESREVRAELRELVGVCAVIAAVRFGTNDDQL